MKNAYVLAFLHFVGRTEGVPRGVWAIALLFGIPSAFAQTWDYQSYNRDGRSAPGYIQLTEKEGKATLQMLAGNLINCYRGTLPVTVTRTDTTIVLTVPPLLTGCDEIRFVMKNDGTGGRREVRRGDEWVWDNLERGLTLRK